MDLVRNIKAMPKILLVSAFLLGLYANQASAVWITVSNNSETPVKIVGPNSNDSIVSPKTNMNVFAFDYKGPGYNSISNGCINVDPIPVIIQGHAIMPTQNASAFTLTVIPTNMGNHLKGSYTITNAAGATVPYVGLAYNGGKHVIICIPDPNGNFGKYCPANPPTTLTDTFISNLSDKWYWAGGVCHGQP